MISHGSQIIYDSDECKTGQENFRNGDRYFP